ncbi:YkvA family protein [Phenylobacterium sp.]|uniref:YkvA family protein n=1 Tax=Phenylobacterium sp. TaxID=1871053 RepID=UPI0035B07414
MTADSKASPHVNDGGFDGREALDPSRALVPAVVRVNERRVARGFWPKIRKTAARIPFAADALSVWYCARDPATPTTAKGLMLAALAYFVLPTDAIPDVLTFVGFTDDAAVFAAMLALVGKHVKPRHKEAAQEMLARLAEED